MIGKVDAIKYHIEMSLNTDFKLSFDPSDISASKLLSVLKEEWRREKSVSKLRDVMHVVVVENDFDVNAVDDSDKTLLDKICSGGERDVKLPIIRSLVESGARPKLKTGQDLIIMCIKLYTSMRRDEKKKCGSVVDYVEMLLRHGAKLNTLVRKNGDVKLHSPCLDYMLKKADSMIKSLRRGFVHLAVMLLVHGACVEYVNVDQLVTSYPDSYDRHRLTMSRDDWQRIVKYLRCMGCKLDSPVLDHYDCCQQAQHSTAFQMLPFVKPIEEVLVYMKSLGQRPDSLEFQCRRVIRRQVSISAGGKCIIYGIDELPLPAIKRDYLKFTDAE